MRVAESTVWRWVDKGLLPGYRLPGRRIRIRKSDVEKAMKPAKETRAETGPPEAWRKWIVHETGVGVDPEAAIEKSNELARKILARRGGVPLPSSVDDIREMREERSRQLDEW